MAAAGAAGIAEAVVNADVRTLIAATSSGGEFIGRVLGRQLADCVSPATKSMGNPLQ